MHRSGSLNNYKTPTQKNGLKRFEKDESGSLREEYLMRNIKPTDEKTMNKILSFANTINQTMDQNISPTKIVSQQNKSAN